MSFLFFNVLVRYTTIFFSFNIALIITVSSTTHFDLDTLTLTDLKLIGDAHFNNASVSLTCDLTVPNSGAGKLLYSKPVIFKRPENQSLALASFTTFFSFSITTLNPSSVGGGLAFVISPDDETVGAAGGSIGLMGDNGVGSGFVAVEFDTLMDLEFNDINGNHVGFNVNTMISSQVGDLTTVDIDLKSGTTVNSWIEYDGSSRVFGVWVSNSNLKPVQPILSFGLDLDQYVNDFMYVGFSGSTQGSTEVHIIEWWSFSSSFGSSSTEPNASALPSTANLTNPAAANAVTSPPSHSTQNIKSSFCSRNHLCKEGAGAVAGVITAGAFAFAISAGFLIWVYTKKLKNLHKSDYISSKIIKTPKQFSYKALKSATNGFDQDRVIGTGAHGTVYKGTLQETGDTIAVKRCRHISRGRTEFLSELMIIATLRHRNLVKLQGWCQEKTEILLVYDLMSNGSLDKALFESRDCLPWQTRTKILLGIASALVYLHDECENQVIHRDVKTSNVMLDDGFNARLGDFGLAREIEHDKSPDPTVAAGTMGYLAPEYILTGKATDKADVFSYGAVVLEVATGKRPIDSDNGGFGNKVNLVGWVWGLHEEEKLLMAADSRLEGEYEEKEMRKVLLVGLACSHSDPVARPSMRNVVQMLAGETPVPEVPKSKPPIGLSTSNLFANLQDSVSDFDGLIDFSSSYSSSEKCFDNGGRDDRLV